MDAPTTPVNPLDFKHVGRLLRMAAAIIESADKNGVMLPDGAFDFSDPAKVAAFSGDVLNVLKAAGVQLPAKADKLVKLLVASIEVAQ